MGQGAGQQGGVHGWLDTHPGLSAIRTHYHIIHYLSASWPTPACPALVESCMQPSDGAENWLEDDRFGRVGEILSITER